MSGAAEGGVRAGVDIGGTGIRVVILEDRREIAAVTLPTSSFERFERHQRSMALARHIRALVPNDKTLMSLGIGASGPVDTVAGVIENPSTLPTFSSFPLVAELSTHLQVPVRIDNDAVTAALGEFHLGAGIDSRRMLAVTLGTGVGVALLIGGQPLRTANGAHSEGGHIPIGDSDTPCYCGVSGCWETLASRTWLQAELARLLPGIVYERHDLGFYRDLYQNDSRIARLFQQYGNQVGRGLGSLMSLYGPDLTVLSGSAAQLFPLYEDAVQASLVRSKGFELNTRIVMSTLGDGAGAMGAALLF
ncbi:ROK family protein [Pseudomonas sp. B21-040]|jgi:glucokinase|uniref:ROK family protein n=1 Tax=Pseudomonas sp. B21-040 TaxID=2895486 RepID=UPI002160B892|nr:ROK family protein [Pseudomonas sp. B21-040]UVL42194.1 ROK family protein [Pseudomonas sp. B21-040]